MKKFLVGLLVFVFAAVSLPGLVLAQDNPATDTTDALVEDVETTPSNAQDRQAKDEDRQARIDRIKARNDERLTANEERNIVGLCRAAQTVVSRMQTNLEKVLENRRVKYSNVLEKLDNLLARLQNTSADTAELESAIAEMDRQAAALIAEIDVYKTTLSDLAEMDCEADPSGFKAVLTDARSLRSDLVIQSTTLKTYVKETIRAILDGIKDQLKTTDASATEEG